MIFRITMNLGLKIYQRKKPDFCWNLLQFHLASQRLLPSEVAHASQNLEGIIFDQ